MSTKLNKKVEEFLVSDSFVNYVIDPTSSLIELWEKHFRNHPTQVPFANEARRILLGEDGFVQLSVFENVELKRRIFEECNLSITS